MPTSWVIRHCRKHRITSSRTIPPRMTIRTVAPLMETIGVTRVGDVTHLDRSGVPSFIAVRPKDEEPGISYYNGKGTSRAQAQASAMMEAIERFSGERCLAPIISAPFEQVRRRAVDPRSLLLPELRRWSPSTVLEWVAGTDLVTGRGLLVPLNAVICPYKPTSGDIYFISSTNGLASGNTLEEAVCHAICEVIERDAASLFQAATYLRRSVSSVLSIVSSTRTTRPRLVRYPAIGLSGLPIRAARLLRRIVPDSRVYLRDITSDTLIPTVECVLAEERSPRLYRCYCGHGTHPNAGIALCRAITEAVQSRVACIQGGREDLPEFSSKELVPLDPDAKFGALETVGFRDLPSKSYVTVRQDIRWLLKRLCAVGLTQVVAVDLTKRELNVPVVRIIIPAAETWHVFHLHTRRGVLGRRAAALLS